MPAVLNTVSGHWESYEVTEIDPEVQDFITKCQNLMYTLGRHQERAYYQLNAAKTALENCKTNSNIETEDISGVYFEDHYLPYKEGFFELGDTLNGECDECMTAVTDRISKLNEYIAAARPYLYRTVTRERWVDDYLPQ